MSKYKFNIIKITLGAMLFTISVAFFTDFYFEQFVIYKHDYANTGKIQRLIENDNKSEVAIFGSSFARNNYFVDSLDFEAFNYGMQGMIFEYLEPLIEIELEKEKNTPIIFDYHHVEFFSHESMAFPISNFVPFAENEKIDRLLKKKKQDKKYLKIKGLRYFGCYTTYLKEHLRSTFDTFVTIGKGGVHGPTQSSEIFELFINKNNQSIENKAYLEDKAINSPSLFSLEDSLELHRLNTLFHFNPNQTEIDRFEKLLENNRDRLVIMVYSPQHYSKLDGIDNYDEVIWFLEKLKKRHPNLKVLNYSYQSYPNHYFRDIGHLSLEGAQHFTGILNKDLKKILE